MPPAKFIRGLLDGALATLGIVIGASAAEGAIILAAAAGGAVANGFSNAVSAFSAESAAQYGNLREIEKAMLTSRLKSDTVDSRVSRTTFASAAADGLATVLGGAVPILPYIFLPPGRAMLVAVGLVVIVTGSVGFYLGSLARKNILLSIIKMAGICLFVAATVYIIQEVIVP